ncbi:MAG: DUF302 domain-containing protein [Acetobacteraceae bacterium]
MDKTMWLGSIAILACFAVCPPGPAHAQQPAPPQGTTAAASGIVTVASNRAVADTIERFETAVRAKGWVVFARLDHAAAATAAGLQLRPRTVIVFGNPKGGTPAMRTNPTLAIDLPLKALVWEDESGKVWLSYNSAEFVGEHVYGRHGLTLGPEPVQGLGKLLGDVVRDATQ